MKLSQLLFCSALLFSATAVQAATEQSEDGVPPIINCTKLTGNDVAICKMHNQARANCVAKNLPAPEDFSVCLTNEVGGIFNKMKSKAGQ